MARSCLRAVTILIVIAQLSFAACVPSPRASYYSCDRAGRDVQVRLWIDGTGKPSYELHLLDAKNVPSNTEHLDRVFLAGEAETLDSMSGHDLVADNGTWLANFTLPTDDVGDDYILIIAERNESGTYNIILAEWIQVMGPK